MRPVFHRRGPSAVYQRHLARYVLTVRLVMQSTEVLCPAE